MHTQWWYYIINSNNPNSRSIFKRFLEKTTQINESFIHHSKKFINKLYAFRGSCQIRSSILILDWNEKYYIFDILQKIYSTQKHYSVFVNSIRREFIDKEKNKEDDLQGIGKSYVKMKN